MVPTNFKVCHFACAVAFHLVNIKPNSSSFPAHLTEKNVSHSVALTRKKYQYTRPSNHFMPSPGPKSSGLRLGSSLPVSCTYGQPSNSRHVTGCNVSVDDAASTGTPCGGRRNQHRHTMWWMTQQAPVHYIVYDAASGHPSSPTFMLSYISSAFTGTL